VDFVVFASLRLCGKFLIALARKNRFTRALILPGTERTRVPLSGPRKEILAKPQRRNGFRSLCDFAALREIINCPCEKNRFTYTPILPITERTRVPLPHSRWSR